MAEWIRYSHFDKVRVMLLPVFLARY